MAISRTAGPASRWGGRLDGAGTLRDQHAPARLRLLHAQAQERQEAFQQDHLRHQQRGRHRHRAERVGHDVPEDDAGRAEPEGAGRPDEVALAQRQGHGAHHAGHVEPFHGRDRHQHEQEARAEEHQQQDHEEHEGEGVEHVDEAHHHRIDGPAQETRRGAVGDADEQRHEACCEPDRQRDPAGDEAAREEIAPLHVGAEGEMQLSDRDRDREAASGVPLLQDVRWPEQP